MEHIQHRTDELWLSISKESSDFEHSLDVHHRKLTGSYYTSLELTLVMMKDLIESLPEEDLKKLYEKRFLEPCVGTGNFVYAYLRVCKDLEFTKEEYQTLLNNIYVCDINIDALKVYKKNVSLIAKDYFSLTLTEEYFQTHIGGPLLVNVDAGKIEYIPIENVFPPQIINTGFDIVATNPPYKNFKAEKVHYSTQGTYEQDKNKYIEIGKIAKKEFPYSSVGTLNLYKMFVEEITVKYLSAKGVASLLIPASILSDKTCSKLRTLILESSSLKLIRIIPEQSNYVDASQSLCAMLYHKGKKTSQIYVDGSFTGKVAKGIHADVNNIIDFNTGNAILVLSGQEYSIRKKLKEMPVIKDIPFIVNLRGELDITLHKESILTEPTQYQFYRGRNIGYYRIEETKPREYVSEQFVISTPKKKFIPSSRLACQQIVNIAKKRRLAFTLIPPHCVLGNSCNFIALQENSLGVDYYFLLGVLNSSLMDWYFKLTSSNNHINNYEIDNFPIPIHYMNKSSISTLVQEYLHTYNESLLVEIENHVRLAFGLNRVDGDQLQLPEERINKNKNNNTDYAACMTTQIDKARNIDEHMYRQTVDKNNKIIKEFPSSDESIIKIVSTTMFKDFVHSIRKIVPAITEKDCAGLLRDSITIGKILCDTELTDFDKHVVENLVRKHKALFANEVLNHTTYKLSDLDLEMIKHVPQGGSWKDIPEETIHKSKRLERITQTGGRTTLYGRIDYSKPSYTITTFFNRPGNGTYVHPVHERVISAREAARFQTFPDDYIFCGNKNDILKQIGNAVPVLLAYNIGTAIRNKTGCCASVDLFSGAGGMTYGFKCAGIKATIANDIMRSACLTLKTNMPDINVLCGDITKKEIKRTIITTGKSGGADIICGGPPCQGFSMAGWRMENDPRNELFKHFVDIVSEIRPKVIVFENVEGLLSYKNGETYRNIIELFSELGYFTEGRKLKANHYGVPQRRNRVIILCTRKDINVPPKDLFPEPTTPNTDRQITAFETISDLENIPCDDNAKNHSNYSSPILQFLKKEITAHEYIQSIRDERGELACTAKTKMKKNSEQLLFDFFA